MWFYTPQHCNQGPLVDHQTSLHLCLDRAKYGFVVMVDEVSIPRRL